MEHICYICAVKFLKIILSVHFLLLSCMPCADAETSNYNNSGPEWVHSVKHHHDDFCSPFCICSCCGSVVISHPQVESFEFFHPNFIPEQKTAGYEFAFISNFTGNIWQPPKINV